MELLDVNWEHILYSNILSNLSLQDLFRLRAVSSGYRDLVHSYFATLLEINLSPYNDSLSTEGFLVLASITRSLQTFVGDNCGFLNDKCLGLLFANNTKLKRVHLRCCKQLTASCLQPLILYCKGLKVLNLTGCPWLTPNCLETLAFHQCNLEEVHLESCPSLDDICLEQFFSRFPRMQVVHLAHLHSVKDNTLKALTKHCRNLRHLDISNCSQITDQGVVALIDCPNLQTLRIAYCASVGFRDTSELATQFDQTHIKDLRPPPPPGWCITRIPRNPGWVFHRKNMVSA